MQRGTEEPFTQVIQAPPIVRMEIELGPDWDPTAGLDATVIADALLRQYDGSIMQFWQAQRHNSALGVAAIQATTMSWPGLRARYQNVQGTEALTITAIPAAVAGSTSSTQAGDTFEIAALFSGWPLPGWQYSAAGNPGWWTGPKYGNYYYDPAFVPAIVSAANTKEGDLAGDTPLSNLALAGVVQLNWQPTSGPSMPFTEPWWNTKVGGSGICRTALSGQQYWEVEITALPQSGSVPPPISVTIPLPGQSNKGSYTDPTFSQVLPGGTNVNETLTWTWPAALDTWLSPVIGLVPATFVDQTWKKNTVAYGGVIGLDYDPAQPRSIGAVRTSLIQGNWSSTAVTPGLATLDVSYKWVYFFNAPPGTPTNPVGQAIIIGQASYPCPDPNNLPTGDTTWNVGDTVVVNNQYLCMCVGNSPDWSVWDQYPGVGAAAGPTTSQCASWWASIGPSSNQPYSSVRSQPPMQVGNAYFVVVAVVGAGLLLTGFYNFLQDGVPNNYTLYGTVTYTPASAGASTSTTSGNKPFGDTFLGPDAVDSQGHLLTSGINALGRHTWVLKGRGDALASTQTPSQDATPDLTSTPPTLGVWSGVDLGDLKSGDIIMVATDTATRKVWFGRNGQWYDTNGAGSGIPADPNHVVNPAVLMDGDAKTLYYPACSWRVGPTKLTMRFGVSQKYAPPSGFKSYGVT